MKKTTSILTAIVIFFSLSLTVFAKTYYLYPSKVINDRADFHVIAHRGLNSLAPENTLSAFRLAGEYGFWGCEFDIYPTRDGQWFVMHDPTIDRMTNGSGAISDMTSGELLKFRIDAGTNIKKYQGEKIPELSQVLDICREYAMHPVIEIKGGTDSQIKELCNYLKTRKENKDFIITSFSAECLRAVRNNMKSVRMWELCFAVTDVDIAFCKTYKIECIDSNLALTTQAEIDKVRSSGLISGVWTADTTAAMEKLYSMGVRYVTTNNVLPIVSPQTTKPQATQVSQTNPPQTTKPAQTLSHTSQGTTVPHTQQGEATINEFLSDENKAMLEIVYNESKAAIRLYKILFG